MKTVWVILAAAVLSSGTSCQKAPAPSAKLDTWERSKECTAQAEKLVAEYDRDGLARGFPKTVWTNHYSPKYNRCFVQIFGSDAKQGRTVALQDAFERTPVADEDPGNAHCTIDSEKVDCVRAIDFITDHMKN
jgi:hypothetical protein